MIVVSGFRNCLGVKLGNSSIEPLLECNLIYRLSFWGLLRSRSFKESLLLTYESIFRFLSFWGFVRETSRFDSFKESLLLTYESIFLCELLLINESILL